MQILNTTIGAVPRPIRNYVLIDPDSEDTSPSGLVALPQQRKVEFPQGTVLALGSGRRDDETMHDFEVKVGDRVLHKMGAPTLNLNGADYVIIKEEDILAIL